MLSPEISQEIEVFAAVIRTRKRRGKAASDVMKALEYIDLLLLDNRRKEEQINYFTEQLAITAGKLSNLESQSHKADTLPDPAPPEDAPLPS